MVAIFGLEVLITIMRLVPVSEVKSRSALGMRPAFLYKDVALVNIQLRASLRLIDEPLRHLTVR